MGKSQRTKGASFEREVCEVFSRALKRPVKRNIGQARDGGNDIDVAPLIVECKRRKSLKTIEGWMAQADAAAVDRDPLGKFGEDDPNIPVVVARSDGGERLIILRLDDFLTLAGDKLTTQG